jgi:hypothetical protein
LPLPKKPVGSITTIAMAKSGSHCFAQTLNFNNHVATLSNTNSQQKIYPALLLLLQVSEELSFKMYAIITTGQLTTFRIMRNLPQTQQG